MEFDNKVWFRLQGKYVKVAGDMCKGYRVYKPRDKVQCSQENVATFDMGKQRQLLLLLYPTNVELGLQAQIRVLYHFRNGPMETECKKLCSLERN